MLLKPQGLGLLGLGNVSEVALKIELHSEKDIRRGEGSPLISCQMFTGSKSLKYRRIIGLVVEGDKSICAHVLGDFISDWAPC